VSAIWEPYDGAPSPKFRYGVEPEVTGLSVRRGGGSAQAVLKGRFKILFRIDNVSAQNRTEILPNTNRKRYRLSRLARVLILSTRPSLIKERFT
jgi:hypothetical protein